MRAAAPRRNPGEKGSSALPSKVNPAKIAIDHPSSIATRRARAITSLNVAITPNPCYRRVATPLVMGPGFRDDLPKSASGQACDNVRYVHLTHFLKEEPVEDQQDQRAEGGTRWRRFAVAVNRHNHRLSQVLGGHVVYPFGRSR